MKLFLQRSVFRAALAMFLGKSTMVVAASALYWGPEGQGGSGNWNLTEQNWWNGSSNVPWTGGLAVFSGAGGTVTSVFPGPSATGITFSSSGYTIQSGWINATSPSFEITTEKSATIGSTLNNSVSGGATLVKKGAATLSVIGTNFLSRIHIEAGEYRVGGTSSLFFSDVSIGTGGGATLTLGNQSSGALGVKSLSGGGIVQPDEQARTVTMTLYGGRVFSGVLQDNGAGKLALDMIVGSSYTRLGGSNGGTVRATGTVGKQTLTNQNSYSGGSSISIGNLELADNGSALNSSINIYSFGALLLENSVVGVTNRISDSAPLVISGGSLHIIGNSSSLIHEHAGQLNYSGAAKIATTREREMDCGIEFSGASRANRGSLSISGDGFVKIVGMAVGSSGILPVHISRDSEWAVLDTDNRVAAFSDYALDINAAAASQHVKLNRPETVILSGPATRASLNLQIPDSGTAGVDLAGNLLNLSEGGILSSGSGISVIENGAVSTSGTEIVINTENELRFSAAFTEAVPGTNLIKTGAGSLFLTGANNYSGSTVINQGTLIVSADSNLGTGATIEFNGGTLQAASSFTSSKGFSKGTDATGRIQTALHDLTFTGSNTGAIDKLGTGTLTLTHSAAGTVFISAGKLLLPNATSGSIYLYSGELEASGQLSSLTSRATCILNIGGQSASNLAISRLSPSQTTVAFGIGAPNQDNLSITSAFRTSGAGNILFDFHDLGGTRTGTDYVLINLPTVGVPVNDGQFSLSPGAAQSGWSATFRVEDRQLKVMFNSIPRAAPQTFNEWANTVNLPEQARGMLDRNGPLHLQNLIAYSMGINPLKPEPGDLPRAMPDPGQPDILKFTYTRSRSAIGIGYGIMSSEDLLVWRPAPLVSHTKLSESATQETWEATVSTAGFPKLFLLLSADKN